jgi:hypothetical protein
MPFWATNGNASGYYLDNNKLKREAEHDFDPDR